MASNQQHRRSNDDQNDNRDEEDDEQLLCGYANCTPRWLQVLHNRQMLLLCMCTCTFVQSFVINGIVPISISTLEKRFNLSSFQSGLFSAVYNVAVLLTVVPVSHYGRKHKGKWTACGIFILGVGSFVWTLPQYLSGPYEADLARSDYGPDYCWADGKNASSDAHKMAESHLHYYLIIFLIGQALHGMGVAPLYCVGVAYIDENVSQRSSPMYLGLFFGSAALGPLAGYMIGGQLLKVYGDWGKSANFMNLGPDDPRWYGAWWIGFIISGTCAILASIPLFSFARQLPGASELRQKDINQTHRSMDQAPNVDIDTEFRELPKLCFNLLKNPTYTSVMISSISETLLVGGFINFMPKLFEHLLHFPVSKAATVAGCLIIPSVFLGNVLGGWVIRRFKLCCAGNLKLTWCCRLVTLLLIFLLLLKCPQTDFASFVTKDGEHTLKNTCNKGCDCSGAYNPVCNERFSISFYSPCYAGCRQVGPTGKDWFNCSCVNKNLLELDQSPLFSAAAPKTSVRAGQCRGSCPWNWLFLLLLALMVFGTFLPMMATSQVFLRCVPFDQRTLAMGMQWCIVRLFGSIPSAVVFGLAIDSTCVLKTKQLSNSHCLRYNTTEMAYVLLMLGLGFKFVSLIAITIGLALYKVPKELELTPIAAPITDRLDSDEPGTISTSESEM